MLDKSSETVSHGHALVRPEEGDCAGSGSDGDGSGGDWRGGGGEGKGDGEGRGGGGGNSDGRDGDRSGGLAGMSI